MSERSIAVDRWVVLADKLLDASDEQLDIIEAVLEWDDIDKIIKLVNDEYMKRVDRRMRAMPQVTDMLKEDER